MPIKDILTREAASSNMLACQRSASDKLICILLFSLAALLAKQVLATNKPIDRLNQLTAYLDNDSLPLPAALYEKQTDFCPLRIVSLAALYRRDPDKYRNLFFATLVIDDYAARSEGKYNIVKNDKIASTLDSAMNVYPQISNQRLQAVIGLCTLQDKNLWASSDQGRISLARFVRGFALTGLLKGTDEDPLAIATAIDKHTALQHNSNAK